MQLNTKSQESRKYTLHVGKGLAAKAEVVSKIDWREPSRFESG
jgi:hypothetical protein